MTTKKPPTRQRKKVKPVKAWAAVHGDGRFCGMFVEGKPWLFPNRAVAKQSVSATARIVRVLITVEG